MNIDSLKDTFKKHAEKYDINESAIMLKLKHSLRVMDLSYDIAEDNDLNKNDTEIATLIGLLHDYARFDQWKNYKTYSDRRSIDHADLGVKKLFEDKEIVNYCYNPDYYKFIYNAIKYHNKYSYPEDLDNRNKMFCKIIRDADKLDIFYLMSIKKIFVKEDEEKIREIIATQFYNNQLLKHVEVNNNSERIILELAMLFDLNYNYSFKYIENNSFIDKLFEEIDNKNKFEPYFDHVKKYVKERAR